MITKAAVKIFDIRQNKEVIIPCHRHSDAYEILYSFGYKKNVDYTITKEGFLDEDGTFLNRHAAWLEAIYSRQVSADCDAMLKELYSEDLW